MNNLIYLKTVQLSKEEKIRHKIKPEAKIPRLDTIALAGYYPPLEALKNSKGQIFFNLIETRGIIDATDRRRAAFWLQCNGLNFSSVFTLDLGFENIVGFGNPAIDKFLKPQKRKNGSIIERPNPFYEYRNDGFLFIATPDDSVLVIIIVSGGKSYIQSMVKKYADGQMTEILEALRSAAQPFFQY
jgi:hypothetical protein